MGEMKEKKTVKRILICVMILVVAFVFAGCVRYEAKMSVGTNKKINIDLLYAEYSGLGSTDSKQDQIDAMKANGWQIADYNDNEYSGWRMSKQGIDFADLEKELQATGFGFSSLTFEEKDDVYTLTWDFSDALDASSTKGSDLSTIGSLGGFLRFYLSLPNKAIEENATSVTKNGSHLEWDLTKLHEPIMVKFDLDSSSGGTSDDTDETDDTDPTTAPVTTSGKSTPSDQDPSEKPGSGSSSGEKELSDDGSGSFFDSISSSTWKIIAIVAACVIAVLLIVIIILLVVLLKKKNKKDPPPEKKAVPVQSAQPAFAPSASNYQPASYQPAPNTMSGSYPPVSSGLPNPISFNQNGTQNPKPPTNLL